MSKPKLVYFRIRGRAEPIRLMLQDIGVEYDEEHPESWAAIKKDMYESGKRVLELDAKHDWERFSCDYQARRRSLRSHCS
jgi:hypothetical protein